MLFVGESKKIATRVLKYGNRFLVVERGLYPRLVKRGPSCEV